MEKNACTFRLSILLTNRGERFVRGPNVILCSPVFNASTEASGGFSRPFGSATIGPLGGSCSISAIHFTASRVSPTSKRILSLITSSAEGSFGNSMMRCRGAFSLVAPTTTKRATGTIAFSSVESAPTLHFGLDSWRG